eukprot:849405-Pleurochrysis_carterae.AAC.2
MLLYALAWYRCTTLNSQYEYLYCCSPKNTFSDSMRKKQTALPSLPLNCTGVQTIENWDLVVCIQCGKFGLNPLGPALRSLYV